MERNISLN